MTNNVHSGVTGIHIFGIHRRNSVRMSSNSRLHGLRVHGRVCFGHHSNLPTNFVRPLMGKSNLSGTFAASVAATAYVAAAAFALAAPASQAQPAPVRQERGNLILEGIPPRDVQLSERLGLFRQSRQATFLDWLPDGAMLVSTRFGDVDQVHRIATPLGMREQLTFYPDPVSAARAPRIATSNGQGNAFVFLKDQGGDENAQIYYYSSSSNVQQLTKGKFLHGSPIWSHDGKRVAFYGNERDGISYDVYVVDIGSTSA